MCPFEALEENSEPDQEKIQDEPEASVTHILSENEYNLQIIRQELKERPEAINEGLDIEQLLSKYGTYKDYLKKNNTDSYEEHQEKNTENLKKIQEDIIKNLTDSDQKNENLAEGVGLLRQFDHFLENKRNVVTARDRISGISALIDDLKIKRDQHERGSKEHIELYNKVGKELDLLSREKETNFSRIKEMVAFQGQMADFIKKSSANETFLEQFWASVSQFGVAHEMVSSGLKEDIDRISAKQMKAAVLSQVSIMHAVELNGHEYRMATIDEDAKDKIDLWAGETAFQIKGGSQELTVNELQISEDKENISYPSAQVTSQNGEQIYVSYEGRLASEKIADFKKRHNIDRMAAYIIAIPYDKMKQTNGMPTEDVVRLIGEKIGHGPNYKEKPAQ